MNQSDITRFWSKVKIGLPDECWEWQGCKSGKGGEFLIDKKRWQPYRFSYFIKFNEQPQKIYHNCNNQRCVNPNHLYVITTIQDALFLKTDKNGNNGCWNWNGLINSKGYGVVSFDKKQYYAHRVSWELINGSIPEGKIVCHHCDNRICVNPIHLFIGTPQDNSSDMVAKNRQPKGINKPTAKLTEEDVKRIKYELNHLPKKEIAKIFNIHQSHVNSIIKGIYWRHI